MRSALLRDEISEYRANQQSWRKTNRYGDGHGHAGAQSLVLFVP